MATDQEIRTSLQRARKSLELRPGMAQGTMKTNLKLKDGIKCICRSDGWTFEVDEPTSMGGESSAPSPGIYGLSALAACVAMSVKMQGALAESVIDAVDIQVEGDYDDRGAFRLDGIPPGFQRFRLAIEVVSPEPEDKVREIVDKATMMSTWFHVFTHPQTVSLDVSVNPPTADLED